MGELALARSISLQAAGLAVNRRRAVKSRSLPLDDARLGLPAPRSHLHPAGGARLQACSYCRPTAVVVVVVVVVQSIIEQRATSVHNATVATPHRRHGLSRQPFRPRVFVVS